VGTGAGAETGTEKRGAAEGAAAMDVVLDSGRAAELAGEAAPLGAEAPPAAAETAGGLTSAEPPDPVAPVGAAAAAATAEPHFGPVGATGLLDEA